MLYLCTARVKEFKQFFTSYDIQALMEEKNETLHNIEMDVGTRLSLMRAVISMEGAFARTRWLM